MATEILAEHTVAPLPMAAETVIARHLGRAAPITGGY